jgi:aldose 1-epimerase
MQLPPPSGRQIELSHDGLRAVVVEVGGGVRTFSIGDWDVLDGYGEDEMCSVGRGQLLLPWPNRIEGGAYRFGGQDLQLPLTEPARRNAIHGLTRWLSWRTERSDTSSATLSCVVNPQPGYPFRLEARVDYRLGSEGLAVRVSLTNTGSQPCPAGAGAHPYLSLGPGLIDSGRLCLQAESYLPSDERGNPTGVRPVEGTEYDFRSPRELGQAQLDTAFTGLGRDAEGRARVEFESADGARRVVLWLDSAHDYVMLFTGDSIPDSSRRRHGLGVEPMTCAPNAFRSGAGLRELEPGESLVAEWGIDARLG